MDTVLLLLPEMDNIEELFVVWKLKLVDETRSRYDIVDKKMELSVVTLVL